MKLFKKLSTLILSTLIAFNGVESRLNLQAFGSSQNVIADSEAPVPGDNPLKYCHANHNEDKVRIDHVNLTPNPPHIGHGLSIEVVGEVLQQIEQGAYAVVEVKYGIITLLRTHIELCKEIQKADLSCPLKEGPVSIFKDVQLPAQIPPGIYNVYADAYTVEEQPITCLQAKVNLRI
ncbi:hypothetical protein K3495_g8158 [Podosphaera aphanis]|nr:hypothetical protein K3495_g8158 [Podosphaera aphanis]